MATHSQTPAGAAGKLREHNIRLTPQRQAILEFLKSTTSHPTAEQVHEHVRQTFPGVSLATVYNTLNLLVDLDLARELPVGDRSTRFDGDVSDHYHVICSRCGRIVDYHGPEIHGLREQAAQRTGFRITGYRVDLYGVCGTCGAGAS